MESRASRTPSHKRNYSASCSIRHAQQATTVSAKSAARRDDRRENHAPTVPPISTFLPAFRIRLGRARLIPEPRKNCAACGRADFACLLLPPLSQHIKKTEPVKDEKIFPAKMKWKKEAGKIFSPLRGAVLD